MRLLGMRVVREGGTECSSSQRANQPTNQRVALIGSLLEHMILETWCNCAVNGK